MIDEGRPLETYTHGRGEFMARVLSRRTAPVDAGFLLPHLSWVAPSAPSSASPASATTIAMTTPVERCDW
ncbi:MAG: hypothetical protein JOZ87_16415 [Chloroflexi bacterium]|nr:hypothetical protein [Chloroflexota bacterium]